jgi:hypothetical protein
MKHKHSLNYACPSLGHRYNTDTYILNWIIRLLSVSVCQCGVCVFVSVLHRWILCTEFYKHFPHVSARLSWKASTRFCS